jgi:hypothetical protein
MGKSGMPEEASRIQVEKEKLEIPSLRVRSFKKRRGGDV